MVKAYDLADLGQKLKDAGLPVALDGLESAGGAAYLALKAWAKESAALSDNKIDDVVAGFYDQLDAVVLPLIDKINGKDN